MSYSIAQIARALGARISGDGALRITHVAEPAAATREALALATSPKYAADLASGEARAAILWDDADPSDFGLEAAIHVARPRFAMAGLTSLMDPGHEIPAGIHPTACIDPSAVLEAEVAIGPFAVIGRDVRIGAASRLGAHVSIGASSRIGEKALILDGVRLGRRTVIGSRFIAQPGAVVGADGFSYVTPEESDVEAARRTLGEAGGHAAQSWHRIHSLGGVEIGDDVEVGANSAVDKGTIRSTRIGSGTKIDNLVHIAHNVEIGADCLFAALTGIAGSTRIGANCVFGGQVGVVDNIEVGDNVVAGGGTKILSNAPAGRVLLGYPAMRMATHVEVYKGMRRLPRLIRDVAALKKSVSRGANSD